MAGKLTSVRYDSLVQRLERMADGIARHQGEDNFPQNLNDKAIRTARQELEDFREKYEALAKSAEQAYDSYLGSFKKAEAGLSKNDDTIRGFYGKKNPVIADFGTKVLSARRVKKAPEPLPSK